MRDLARVPGVRWFAGALGFIALAAVAIGAVLWVWDQRSSPTTAGDDSPVAVGDGDGSAPVVDDPSEPAEVVELRTDEPWPVFGRTATHSSLWADVALPPPLKETWRLEGDKRVRVPPVVAYGRLYSVSEHGDVLALDVESGEVLWEQDLRRCVGASMAVSEQIVYVPLMDAAPCKRHTRQDPGYVVALDATTGEELWRFEAGLVESAPVLAGGRLFVGSWDGDVYALEAATGEEIWSSSTNDRIRGGVAVRQRTVYVGSFDSSLYAFAAGNGDLRWSTPVGGGFFSTPAVVRGQVLAGNTDNNLYSFDAETGEQSWVLNTGGIVYGTPAIWQETAYATSFDGTVYAIDLELGGLRWSVPTGAAISGSASVIGGVVYVSTTDRRTLAFDAKTGQELWSFDDGRRAHMITDGERLFLAGDRIVYALEPDPDALIEPVDEALVPPEPAVVEPVEPVPAEEPLPSEEPPPPATDEPAAEEPPAPDPEPAVAPPPPEEAPAPDPTPAEPPADGAAAAGR